ncbi:hypothetical protein [Sphingorhabdus sp.]|jgi:hypothetical protein|uniref:hypothetical protein n=1 Tax=Sphingorhabdus sp. TaxID=1902408 RepID=UPI0037C8399E
MIGDKTIEAIKLSAFKLNCLSISLTQTVSTNPIVFAGTGEICQDEHGNLTFSCSASEVKNLDWAQWFNRAMGSKPGKLVSSENYFDLRLKDDEGREWTASNVKVNWTWHAEGPYTANGNLTHLCHTSSVENDARESCVLHFFDDVKLPFWPAHRAAQFESKFAQIEVHEESKGHFIVHAKASDKLPASFPLRIEEALGFLTSVEASPQIITVSDSCKSQTTIYSKGLKPPSGSIPRPLGGNITEFFDYGWELFRCYLDYIASTSKPGLRSHVSYYVHNARTTSSGSVDSWAVSVSVAVEGLSNLLGPRVTPSQKILVGEFRDWLMPLVASNPKFSTFNERLGGLIGMLAVESVKDRLSSLIETNEVTAAYVSAWNNLRNKFVHPKAKDLVAFSDEKLQQLLDLLYKVTALMYEIIFHLIGYRGPYRDCGTDGWPIRRISTSSG